jgi:hypothetical protein
VQSNEERRKPKFAFRFIFHSNVVFDSRHNFSHFSFAVRLITFSSLPLLLVALMKG